MLVISRRLAADHVRERRVVIGTDMILELVQVTADTAVFTLHSPRGPRRVRLAVADSAALAPGVAVFVCGIERNKVRVGFRAERAVEVYREELLAFRELAAVERASGYPPADVTAAR